VILEGAHDRSNNYTDLGHSYELPSGGMKRGSNEAQSYLAGSYKFKVKELEVFQVILKH
jgi:hypothetical protein